MTAIMAVYADIGGSDNTPATTISVSGLGPPLIRLKTNDDLEIDALNPIPIPSNVLEVKQSFWKHVYLFCTTAPDTQVDNIKLYSDSSDFGTGIFTWVGDETPARSTGARTGYAVALGTVGDTGRTVDNHTDVTATTDLFSYTSGAPKSVSISETTSIIDAAGEGSNYVLLQMCVASNASSGDLADETITFQYDEI